MPRVRGLILAMLVVVAVAPVVRAPVGHADDATFDQATRSAIQGVIAKQLDALSHEDGTAAEALASAGIRKKFPDGAAFMAMVHKSYGALIRPKSTAFGALESSPHGPLQSVTIVAADGTVWTAIYSFEQVDGDWRITGCGLQREDGQMDI